MGKFRDRTCTECGAVEYHTATRAEICLNCYAANKAKSRIEPEHAILKSLGYTDISLVGKDRHGKRQWQFTHSCGTIQTWIFPNIRKQRAIHPDIVPCSKCGGKRRMAIAMSAYEAKYGITEEQMVEYERYRKKVRHLSDKVFKEHHDEINPLHHKRGMHSYHLDHITPIIEGFVQGLTPEFMARKENLQMLPAKDNLSKGRK